MANSDVIAKASIAVSVSAFFSGALIAIVAVSIFVWAPLEPQAKKCLETAKFTQTINTTTTYYGVTTTTQREEAVGQCGGQKSFYENDIPMLDTQMTVIVEGITLGIVVVSLFAGAMNLPPICSAIGKKKGNRCLEKCCGCISCFSTLIGFGLGIGCIVLPYMASAELDTAICSNPEFAFVVNAIKDNKDNFGEYCTETCLSVLIGFFDTLCGFKDKFMTIAGVSFLLAITAFTSFIVNAISCFMKSDNKEDQPQINAQVVPVQAVQVVQQKA